ncbi:TonB-dependent receptor [Novosphingobium resinovorum]|uniref:TonB-dependent receptor n=1 Tax=Novosphingobium resinovorum TaxID=158500 RepID=A0A031K3F0_9SPHN|nr:TonB-dependent receptor [Novosphingobium resinovorum]EZP83734.1 TonB-dependent receptor [Novosphingobium resinovorum]
MKTARSTLLLGVAAIPAIAVLAAAPARAQEASAQGATAQSGTDTADESGDAITVTGTRITIPNGFDNPNPVVSVTAATIEQSGRTNITEFLSQSPALLGSRRAIDSAGSNLPNGQLTGVNLLNLRNLGTARTLVLVDGRRHVAGYPGTASVDTNTIPTDLIESVDVLTGGVSAIYGADGVSGVVNFIMKKDFEGLRIRGQNTISQRGDAGEKFLAATAGTNFDDGKGNITLAYEFNKTDRFSQRKRLNYGKTGPTWSFVRNPADGAPGSTRDDPNVPDRVLMNNLRWADSSMGGAIDIDFDGVPDYTGEGNPYDLGTYVPGTAFTVGGDSTPRDSYYGDYTPFLRRHIVNVMGHYEVSPALNFYAEAKYVRSKAYTFAQPTYDFYTELFADNYYLNERFGANAPDGALVSRDNFDFGIRRSELNRELWRTVVGANGELSSHLKYDASFVFGQSTQRATASGDRILDRYSAALDAVSDGNGGVTCRINLPGQTEIMGNSFGSPFYSGAPLTFQPGQCVPLNVLGNGSPSPEALAFILATHTDYARLRQYVGSASISGDTGGFFELPGGPIGFAVGLEYRKESSLQIPSYYTQNGFLADSAQATIDGGSYDVKEAYAEIRLPILLDAPLAHELSLGGALRVSDYSTVGTNTAWNVNGTYAPIADVSFRGTYSVSVRAPNITELFAGTSGGYEFITDPCGPERIAEGKAPRQANCTAALTAAGLTPQQIIDFNPADDQTSPQNSSLLGTQGGNPNLSEEKAKTWTAGVVLRPSFLKGFTLSADWYNIRISKAINYSTAQDIVDLCYDQPTLQNQYCSLITRSGTTGYINGFSVVPQNVASYKTAGLDLNLQYRLEASPAVGSFLFSLVGNYLNKLEFVPSLGAVAQNELDSSAYPAPKFSATFDLTWIKGPFSLNYGINWWDKTRRVTREQQAANPDYLPSQYIWYKEKWEHELYASYNVDDRFTIYGGVNNLFDTKPDVGAVAYPISAVGRSFFMGVKANVF